MPTPTIRAIPTFYAGHYFRSRLEARWAVFFDTCGIKWEYEKEGYSLPSGPYLPDFWLPKVSLRDGKPGVWVEIKPVMYTKEEERKAIELARETGSPVMILCGSGFYIGNGTYEGFQVQVEKKTKEQKMEEWPSLSLEDLKDFDGHETWIDNCMSLHKCVNPNCGDVKFEFDNHNYWFCSECSWPTTDEPFRRAAVYAQCERFESPKRAR